MSTSGSQISCDLRGESGAGSVNGSGSPSSSRETNNLNFPFLPPSRLRRRSTITPTTIAKNKINPPKTPTRMPASEAPPPAPALEGGRGTTSLEIVLVWRTPLAPELVVTVENALAVTEGSLDRRLSSEPEETLTGPARAFRAVGAGPTPDL